LNSCCGIAFSEKSFGAKSGEHDACPISVIDFWSMNYFVDRERLVSWSIDMVENPIVGPKFGPCSKYRVT